MRVQVKTLVLGGGAYIAALGGGYYFAIKRGQEGTDAESSTTHGNCTCLSAAERLKVFSKGASKYDTEIGTDEFVMGLNLLRLDAITHYFHSFP